MILSDMPFLYDHWLSVGEELEEAGRWDAAAHIFGYIASLFGNVKTMAIREANALYHFEDYRSALRVLGTLIDPTVSSLLIEARCWVKLDKPEKACIIYKKAERILDATTESD